MNCDESQMKDSPSERRIALRSTIDRFQRSTIRANESRRSSFRKVVERLNVSILESFRRDEWPRFCQLNEVFEKGLGLPVPSLSICGQGTAEIRYTKLLSWYFDSRNPHGLGGLLAEAVFKARLPDTMEPPSFANCISEAEVGLGTTIMDGDKSDNSLDIMVRAGEWVICVEQKVLSSEGHRQLERYSDALLGMFNPDRLACFYLTPYGKPGKDPRWIPISHQDLVLSMAQVLQRRVLFPTARYNLKTLLWDLMLGPVAQDEGWIKRFRGHVGKVAKQPNRYYADLSRWLSKYNIDQESRKALLNLVEV